MAESLEVLIRIQGQIAQCRRLAAETSNPKTAKRLFRLADDIEWRAREVDRLLEPTIFE
jgi:hypothetical protein